MKKFTIADFQQRILDGRTPPWIMQAHHNGIGYWMVSMDAPSNGLCGGAGRISVETWCSLSQCAWNYQNYWDMILYGWTDQEHDANLLNFLEVCQRNNLTLNPDKMQFRLPKVSFFGHTWSDKGLAADPKKIKVVKKMKISQDVKTMRSFLGMINYLNRFSPRLAELSDPLRQICRQKEEFQLSEACKDAFHWCKEEILKSITLTYFNPKSPTILHTDASKKGLGAVLLQNSTPVMFASRALTRAE